MTVRDPAETAASSEAARVVVEDVVTGYENHEVLHGVSVRSHPNVTCIFGPNGSGKSTLLKAIGGMLPVWSGSVTYGGEDVTDREPHETLEAGISMLPQDGGLFGSLTVEENLRLGGHATADRAVLDERMDQVFEAFPALEGKLDERARSLSGGQQMMLGFGCSMMTDADVYLLDEPTAGLAPSLVDDVIDMTGKLVERGAHLFLVEQNVTAGLRVADYVYVLAQGRIQFEGPPADLADEDELIEVYLGIE